MSTQPKPYLTPEQYLEIERAADFKSEYFDGEMFAMSGAREAHNLVVANLLRELGNQLRNRPCRVYPSDMRILVNSTGLYAYPDVTALCGAPQFLDGVADTLLNPELIVEVLSPSTEAYDRGLKFDHYKNIGAMRDYLLLATDRIHADLYTRQPDNRWLLTSSSEPEASLTIESLGMQLIVSTLYEKIEFSGLRGRGPGTRPLQI